jgi:hypothetical protein
VVSFQIPLTALIKFADPKNGFLTDEGRSVIQQLIDRTGGATGGTILFAGDEVYGVPTGTLLRTTFVSNPALPVGAGYSQAEVTAIRDQVIVLGERIAALIVDSQAVGVIA